MNQIQIEEVQALIEEIMWAWNTRDKARLCAAYSSKVRIIHPNGSVFGEIDEDALHNTICNDIERMGYLHIEITDGDVLPANSDGDLMAEMVIHSKILSADLSSIIESYTWVIVEKRGGRLSIVHEKDATDIMEDQDPEEIEKV